MLMMISLLRRTWLVRVTRTVMRTGRTTSCKALKSTQTAQFSLVYGTKHTFSSATEPLY
jgi:hypothetical protein